MTPAAKATHPAPKTIHLNGGRAAHFESCGCSYVRHGEDLVVQLCYGHTAAPVVLEAAAAAQLAVQQAQSLFARGQQVLDGARHRLYDAVREGHGQSEAVTP